MCNCTIYGSKKIKWSYKRNIYFRAFKYLIEEGKDPANVDENGDELEMDEDDSEGMCSI